MTKEEQIKAIVYCLNSANEADPHAFHALLINVVPTNQKMVDHPHMIVNGRLKPYVTIGLLGVINGILTAADLPRIATKWSDTTDEDGTHEFLGFTIAPDECQPKKEDHELVWKAEKNNSNGTLETFMKEEFNG